jgi:hypothetical protein
MKLLKSDEWYSETKTYMLVGHVHIFQIGDKLVKLPVLRKWLKHTSKHMPHQGEAECQRRLKKLTHE